MSHPITFLYRGSDLGELRVWAHVSYDRGVAGSLGVNAGWDVDVTTIRIVGSGEKVLNPGDELLAELEQEGANQAHAILR